MPGIAEYFICFLIKIGMIQTTDANMQCTCARNRQIHYGDFCTGCVNCDICWTVNCLNAGHRCDLNPKLFAHHLCKMSCVLCNNVYNIKVL